MTGVGGTDMVYFGSGLTMGSVVELAANTDRWPCLNSLSSLLSNGYMLAFYIDMYMTTQDRTVISSMIGYS